MRALSPVDRRTMRYVIGAIVLAAALGYLFSLFPKSNTPHEVYYFTPMLLVLLGDVVVKMVLLRRRPDSVLFKKDWVYGTWVKDAASGCAFAGALPMWIVAQTLRFQRTASWLAFCEFAVTLGFCAVLWAGYVRKVPRRSGQALLVVAGLLVVMASVAPLVHPQGPEWIARGFHPSYVLAASAVLVAAGGILALRQARYDAEEASGARSAEAGASVKRQTLFLLILGIVFAAVLFVLFRLFLDTASTNYASEIAAAFMGALVTVVITMILLNRQSEAEQRC